MRREEDQQITPTPADKEDIEPGTGWKQSKATTTKKERKCIEKCSLTLLALMLLFDSILYYKTLNWNNWHKMMDRFSIVRQIDRQSDGQMRVKELQKNFFFVLFYILFPPSHSFLPFFLYIYRLWKRKFIYFVCFPSVREWAYSQDRVVDWYPCFSVWRRWKGCHRLSFIILNLKWI